jgi:hypothetical protein
MAQVPWYFGMKHLGMIEYGVHSIKEYEVYQDNAGQIWLLDHDNVDSKMSWTTIRLGCGDWLEESDYDRLYDQMLKVLGDTQDTHDFLQSDL